ncbi:MAG: N-acetyl-gamma-glutamyl-phosphate reductase [Planctomycetota bacterium]
MSAVLDHSGVLPAVVVGAAGYTGQELVRLLAPHPRLELAGVFGSGARDGSSLLSEIAPALRGVGDLALHATDVETIASIVRTGGVVFLATPHGASVGLAPAILDAAPGALVADLSAGFRLKDSACYPAFYGFEHAAPALLAGAVYGLPEVSRDGLGHVLEGSRLVACAGCYVTAASIPLAALARAGAIASGTRPIIDAVSGVSGAGRGASLKTSFCELSATPYGVLNHRHRPEIEQAIATPVVFQPHLGAFDRGILATIHVELAPGFDAPMVGEVFASALGGEAFVRLLGDATASPGAPLPSVGAVRGTNRCDLAWAVETGAGANHLIVFSAIDNLVKGASGQAIQCVNAAMGWDEALGLLPGLFLGRDRAIAGGAVR